MVGLQHRGWQVGAQPQLFAAPHLPPPPNMDENSPASALALIPSRATTAVSDWIHFIRSVSLRLNRVASQTVRVEVFNLRRLIFRIVMSP